ncbi:unnamed protein product [Orchesella dallaii]|uniref:Uncharacterized protein n=1 Tax=Orchesella dallaii TaxID=48710 RepID=A0ABP1RCY9_9HEXA
MATTPSVRHSERLTIAPVFSDDILYPFGGRPEKAPKKERKVHPEQGKIDKMFDVIYGDYKVDYGFWTTRRRLRLNYISQRIFFMCAIAGIILTVLTILWKMILVDIQNIYEAKIANGSVPAAAMDSVKVRTPFVEDIKLAKEALQFYLFGACLLAIGGMWSYVTMDEELQLRVVFYCFSLIIMILSTAAMIVGPLFPMRAHNSDEETQSLDKNEYLARQQAVLGSIKYFRSRQCADIDKATAGLDEEKAFQMRTFCNLITRLLATFHLMWFTTVIPVLGFIMSLLQIIVNKKYWNMRKACQYKERTPQQILEDRCTKD